MMSNYTLPEEIAVLALAHTGRVLANGYEFKDSTLEVPFGDSKYIIKIRKSEWDGQITTYVDLGTTGVFWGLVKLDPVCED